MSPGAVVVIHTNTKPYPFAAVILNMGGGTSASLSASASSNYQLGVLAVLGASFISGLSAALSQRALVGSKPRHPIFFSAELAAYGITFLLVSGLFSKDKDLILSGHLFDGWEANTLIPVTTNVSGTRFFSWR